MHPAAVMVMQAPRNVSSRAHFRSAKRSRLSAMQLCWKKSCQGAMVVPTMAITRNIRSGVSPPAGIEGARDPRTICPMGGRSPKAIANQTKSRRHRRTTVRSHRR